MKRRDGKPRSKKGDSRVMRLGEETGDDVFSYVEMFSLDWTDCGRKRRGVKGRNEERKEKRRLSVCVKCVCDTGSIERLKRKRRV